MIHSYSQISQYLRCPRGYRHRYLDGWCEKDSRAALLFGRCFEKALEAYFLRADSTWCFLRNGASTRKHRWSIRRVRTGRSCFGKASSGSSGSPRMTGFASANPGATSRSS